jgi:hypothetical protein
MKQRTQDLAIVVGAVVLIWLTGFLTGYVPAHLTAVDLRQEIADLRLAALTPPASATESAREQKIINYLRAAGAVDPEIFAYACMTTSRPELCAAMALRESTCRVACPTGAAGEKSSFQITEPIWGWLVGRVSQDPFVAAKQWELIMTHLEESTTSLPMAVGAYNGYGKGYVAWVWGHYRAMGGS